MYEKVFNLNARPFTSAPYVKHYFPGESIHGALTQVKLCVERGSGPAVVIGATGTGKSLLLAMLEQQFFDVLTVVNLSCAKLTERKELLQTVLFELGLPFRDMSEAELRLSLIEYLKSADKCPNGILLLIDEAHTLPAGALDEVQLMTNFVRNGESQVRLVLAGNHGLDDHLVDTRLESMNQRISCRCYLETMNSDETQRYIAAHISRAGGIVSDLFGDCAMDTVHSRSGGCARLINQICDQAMIVAASVGSKKITDEIVEQAWSDIQCVPGTLDYKPNTTGALDEWQSVTSEDSSIEVSTQFSDETFGIAATSGSSEQHVESPEPLDPTNDTDADDSWMVFEVESEAEQNGITETPLGQEFEIQAVADFTEDAVGGGIPDENLDQQAGINPLQSTETFVNPFDETFVQEETIVNDFVPQVAEHNLTSLNVSTEQLNVLEGIASELQKQETENGGQGQQQDEIVVSDESDLRLNPEELAKVEAIEREIERIESQAQTEQDVLRIIPTEDAIPEPQQLAIQPIAIQPTDAISQPIPQAASMANIPIEYSLGQTQPGQTGSPDDKDMLIVSRVEEYVSSQIEDANSDTQALLPVVDPTQPSMPSTGSVTRMEYQELFEQLRKND